MKTRKFIQIAAASFLTVGFTVTVHSQPAGRGLPPAARDHIHTLLNQHGQIVRRLSLNDEGYVATTTSTNPVVATALRKHVAEMGDRLKSGLMVRRWDPAFAEYAAYYDQIDHQFEAIEGGLRATVRGRNPEAVKVAQNHARVIVDFATNGWEGHDRSHAAALDPASTAAATSAPAAGAAGKGDVAASAHPGCGSCCCRPGAPE
jgi:hypothetical protein